jgi:hypothetical protein
VTKEWEIESLATATEKTSLQLQFNKTSQGDRKVTYTSPQQLCNVAITAIIRTQIYSRFV